MRIRMFVSKYDYVRAQLPESDVGTLVHTVTLIQD